MFPEVELKEGWISVVCLLLMLACVAWAIQAAEWTEGLAILQGIVLGGGITGIVLAKSRFPNRLAHLLSLLAGWTWAVYLTSQVLAGATGLPASLAVVELDLRFQALFGILFTDAATADNHVFLLLLSLLLWLVAYSCAWAVFRWQKVWWAVTICGVALLLNVTYAEDNLTLYLILFLLFALLLVVRANVAFHEQEWRAARVSYNPELIAVVVRAGLIVSSVAILLAWVAPEALASRPLQPFWDKVGEPWRKFQDRSSRIFQDLNYQNRAPLISLGDRRMWFGGPVNLSDTPIADVRARDGRYWRVLVFHEYLGDGWISSNPDTILIGAGEQDLALPQFELRFVMTQTVSVQRDWGVADALIAAGQPFRAGLPLRAEVALLPQEAFESLSTNAPPGPDVPGDPSAIYAREPLKAGESYQVLSSLTEVDEESLRQAGTTYPAWVVPRYLQLEDLFSARVRLLAEEITAGLDTPYDKAKAIETYLRGIEYNDQVKGPAPGQDGVEYFLFDAQAGYCEYYASAMVVMLRAVDVPARYVQGYSRGAAEDGVYHILESDGHAWPEVFFPGYGWIEFEPTGGEPALVRPASQDTEESELSAGLGGLNANRNRDEMLEAEMDPDLLGPRPTSLDLPFWRRVGWAGWLAISLALVAVVMVALLGLRHQRQMEGLSVTERVYEDLVNWGKRLLHIEPLAHQTPLEYGGAMVQQVPRGRQAVERITGLYVEERFSGKPVPGAHAEAAWRQAWRALWQRWFERRVRVVRRFWWWLVPPKEPPET